MKPETPKTPKRRLRRFVVVLVWIIGALGACFLGLVYYAKPEMIGLLPAGSVEFEESSRDPSMDPYDWRLRVWSHTAGQSSREVYRFVYARSFHSPICVSAWQEGERYWIRSSVAVERNFSSTGDPSAYWRWERTRPLPVDQWNQIRVMFSKSSVMAPFEGKEIPEVSIFDGSYWSLEAVVDGRTTQIQIDTPEYYGSTSKDFIEAGRRMLEYGRVTVREMD